MSRTRAYRRAARLRVIARRLRHIRQWSATQSYIAAIGPGQLLRTFTLDGEERWVVWPRPERRQNDPWGHDVPGKWAKQDPYAHGRCGVCRWNHAEARLRLQKRIDTEAIREYLRR